MKLIDMLSSIWAIMPDHLNNITAVVNAHIRGPKLDLGDIEAKIKALDGASSNIEQPTGVKIIPIIGVITKRPSAFERIFYDAVSSEKIKNDFIVAVNDPSINKIILYIDSPGGTVDGTEELVNAIYENRGKKSVIAYSDGVMASAAYWIGSAADKLYISSGTVIVGSIGVVAIHVDYSEQNKQMGVMVTEIYAGKYKRIASAEAPLTEEGAAYIQGRVDYLYSIMIDSVARNRGVSAETVLTNMADGRIFIGQQSIDAGLVDGMSADPLDINNIMSAPGVGARVDENNDTGENIVDIKELKEKFSDIYQAVFNEGASAKALEVGDIETSKKESFIAGAKYERERIQAIKSKSLPGHEALVESLMFDGKTTPEQAADAVLKAERESREKRLAEFQNDLKPAAHADAIEDVKKPDDGRTIEEKTKGVWEKSSDIRSEFGDNYDAYLAYEKASADGLVRIYKGGKN